MKRLLRISFDQFLLSFIPIISWFILSLIVDKNLINIFTLIYPIQFIYGMFKSVFSTGANISKEKDKNENAVMSGLIIGSIVGLIVFGFIVINIDSYINFMNMDTDTYRLFGIYYVIQLYIQLVFTFILNKLYYEEKNSLANKYSLIFNILNFIVLIGGSLLLKNSVIVILITLISLLLFTIIIFIKSFDKFKLKFNILNFLN